MPPIHHVPGRDLSSPPTNRCRWDKPACYHIEMTAFPLACFPSNRQQPHVMSDSGRRSLATTGTPTSRLQPPTPSGLCSRAHARRTCDAIWLENAVDGNRQRRTDFAHSIVSEAAETLGERPYRNAFNRIEIDR